MLYNIFITDDKNIKNDVFKINNEKGFLSANHNRLFIGSGDDIKELKMNVNTPGVYDEDNYMGLSYGRKASLLRNIHDEHNDIYLISVKLVKHRLMNIYHNRSYLANPCNINNYGKGFNGLFNLSRNGNIILEFHDGENGQTLEINKEVCDNEQRFVLGDSSKDIYVVDRKLRPEVAKAPLDIDFTVISTIDNKDLINQAYSLGYKIKRKLHIKYSNMSEKNYSVGKICDIVKGSDNKPLCVGLDYHSMRIIQTRFDSFYVYNNGNVIEYKGGCNNGEFIKTGI